MPTFNPGDTFHQLAIEKLLGAGFHGEVYAVRHLHTGERFALKVSHAVDRSDANAVRRAITAARGTYSIDHANVVEVFDLGCEDDGMVWTRMELLKGCTLAALIAWQGRVSPLLALSVAYEAAWGLAAAHEALVVHRDVKPGNLFLVDLGSNGTAVKLLDFSIAKVLPDSVATTFGRNALGTPAYMSPEQLYCAPAHPCFDIYALGLTLWEMLAGYHPFHADLRDMPALLVRQVREVPPSLVQAAGLPQPIDDLVQRALRKDAATRYPSMVAFARALDDARRWFGAEVSAGRIVLPAYANEPAPPGVPAHLRACVVPVPAQAAQPRAAGPEPRVILAADEPEDAAATLPLGESGLFELIPLRDAVIPPPPAKPKEPR
jgi:serine/threonine-protein kinase